MIVSYPIENIAQTSTPEPCKIYDTPDTPDTTHVPFNETLSGNQTTVICKQKNHQNCCESPSSCFQSLVNDILDVNPDEPIGNFVTSSTPMRNVLKKPVVLLRKSPRISRSNDVSSSTSVDSSQKNSERPLTRSQLRYLTQEETLERASFNGMSPSIF